jgi:hypothetical protein
MQIIQKYLIPDIFKETNLLLALTLPQANRNSLSPEIKFIIFALRESFSFTDTQKALTQLTCLKLQHTSKEQL